MSAYTKQQLETIVQRFAQETLKPSNNDIDSAKVIQQRVHQVLVSVDNPFKIDRLVVSGSFGKAVHIANFDIDLVVFVNNLELGTFEKLLQEWYRRLYYSGYFQDIELKLPYLIKLKCGKYSVDVVPAMNLITLPSGKSSYERMINQHINALNKIKENHNPNSPDSFLLNLSLVEYQVEFIKGQSVFVKQLIRLCKHWKNRINLEEKTSKIKGFSLAIELLATHVGKVEEAESSNGQQNKSIVRGFQNFLNELKNFNGINVVFKLPFEITGLTYPAKPVIMDSANPWENLASRFNQTHKEWLKEYAQQTLIQLESLLRSMPYNADEHYVTQRLFSIS